MIWAVQMSTVEFHPWNSRRADTEAPDEWRIDPTPCPAATGPGIRRVAYVGVRCLDDLGMRGFPRRPAGGTHIYVRIEPAWGFADVRRAPTRSRARSSAPRPADVTTAWWRKTGDQSAVFVDYNQNTRDHDGRRIPRCAAIPAEPCRY